MERKKQFRYFSIFSCEKEQEYLRQMHKNGWKLEKINGFGIYFFEKCVPQDVIYQLDYNEEGLKNKEEYVKMFQDCGWEFVQGFVGYSYFRKAADENGQEEGIFSDESSRLEMMQRVLKRRMLPLLVIFFAILLPQAVFSFSHSLHPVILVLTLAVLGMYLAIFVQALHKYMQYKNSCKK